MPHESDAGPWTIPRDARQVFKTYCDHTFGGQTWLDVLLQMGGCPSEFVDAWNQVIDQRLEAAFLGLWGVLSFGLSCWGAVLWFVMLVARRPDLDKTLNVLAYFSCTRPAGRRPAVV